MKHWIQAARLRTLPLSVSGILVGSLYALANPTNEIYTPTQVFNWYTFGFALLTTLGLQILSNFANDYGDGIKGTDNLDRIGPARTIQSGLILPLQMKNALYITAIITFLCAIALIYVSFKDKYLYFSLLFFVLGILAIASAIRYTVGNSAYGYKGYGDLFVFIFFGIVSTLGVNFLHSKQFDFQLLLPAAAIGFLSVGVLNLNNMRDEVSDTKSGKNTLVVKLGGKWAKKYHYFLILSAIFFLIIFSIIYNNVGFRMDQYIFVVAFLPLITHLRFVYYCNEPRNLDPELKKLALSTFFLSILLALVLIF